MKNKQLVLPLVAILGISSMETAALIMGIDGKALAAAIGMVGAIGGAAARSIIT